MSTKDSFHSSSLRPNHRVAPLSAALVPQAVALELRCGLSTRGIEGYHHLLADPNLLALVALDSPPRRGLIGLFSATLVLDELHIDNLATDPLRRQQGIAARLLRDGLTTARQRGAKTALLEVRPSNHPALALYLKFGFQIDGRRPAYYHSLLPPPAPPEDALLLSCRL
ncbi:MAG: GNAT family N-acetyltransferase [Blastocatellia bacterium]